ncbi:MAG: TetR/AcrR family transcriptional regulator [Bdellovibrionota bacterium]|jgi:AcrR family transcriptional regulator|nr:TetR/AcrR family transcriptional regulator [Bdellovibrionota bacterium]
MSDKNSIDSSIYELFEFKPKKGDLKKMEIVLAAIECIATIGFEKTTYEAIAQKIGTRRAHVAYHFKDKADIFEACIKFINASYQKMSLEKIEAAQDGLEMLTNYAEAPFLWAKENPQQLSVMLLFYYLCSVDEKYRDLHASIRRGGHERIQYILNTKLELQLSPQESQALAKSIQNLVSGAIMDVTTTANMGLDEAREAVKKQVLNLVN